MTKHSIHKPSDGFTLVEILLVILLMGILSAVSISLSRDSVDEGRFNNTLAKMNQIKEAMLGNPAIKANGVRTSFGYLGDVGGIPSAAQGISALVTQPTPPLPAWSINSNVRFGLGWNGPYLMSGSPGADYTKDEWGRTLIYTPTGTPPALTSYGADGVAGGTGVDSDIVLTLPSEMRSTTVNGFICKRGGPYTGASAQVELNYPNGSGTLSQSLVTLTALDKGQFSFSNVPFGTRSVTVYLPDKATATPSTTTGPVVITVDRPNFMIPCHQLDIDP